MGSDHDPGAVDFVVGRDDLRRHRFLHHESVPEPGPDEVLLRVEKFALTANNVSYALTGDALSYWKFFPTEPGWGRIPAWGFGRVVSSRADGVAEGERFFGYFPMSTHVRMQPAAVSERGFTDVTPHRQELPPIYNRYARAAGESEEREDLRMLFWPLFATSFLLDDFLSEGEFFGAKAVVLTSASSKTALGLAFLLSQRRGAPRVVGLTSPRNRAFVEKVGLYDESATYESVPALPADRAVAVVDMAGDRDVLTAIYRQLGENVKHASLVGATHWERGGEPDPGPGARPSFFFAPTHIERRMKDWGPEGFESRLDEGWERFLEAAPRWVRVVHGRGEADLERVYRGALEGRLRPDEGHVLSLG